MQTTRTGYLMAMLAGLAIVGASTGGVLAATSRHEQTLAAEQTTSAAAIDTSSPSVPAQNLPSPSAGSSPATQMPDPPVLAATSPSVKAVSTGAPSASALSKSAGGSKTTPATAAATTPAPTSPKPPATTAAARAQKYKDGQYSAIGSYNSPGGIEKLGVTITLTADKVTKANLDLLGGAGLSHSFQTAFASGYAGQVIGKEVDSISLGAVSGSSLTGLGFNSALKQIETQALRTR